MSNQTDLVALSQGNATGLTPLAGSVVQVAYEKFSSPVSVSASSYDVITMNFTPMYSTSLLMLETSVFIGATDSGSNIDIGMKILRDGTQITTGANASGSSGGNDVLDGGNDFWNADNRGGWFRMRFSGTITTTANSTSQTTFIVRVQTDNTRTININRAAQTANMTGVSHLKVMEIAQ